MLGGVWVLTLAWMLLVPGKGWPGRALADGSSRAPLGPLEEDGSLPGRRVERARASTRPHPVSVPYRPLRYSAALFEMVTLQPWCSSVFLCAQAIVAFSSAVKTLRSVFVLLFPADIRFLTSLQFTVRNFC